MNEWNVLSTMVDPMINTFPSSVSASSGGSVSPIEKNLLAALQTAKIPEQTLKKDSIGQYVGNIDIDGKRTTFYYKDATDKDPASIDILTDGKDGKLGSYQFKGEQIPASLTQQIRKMPVEEVKGAFA